MQKHERMIHLLEKMKGLGMKQGLLSNIDLSLSQFSMLVFVARMPGSRANEVADAMGLSAATVSVALRKLEVEGWISRKEDPEDKRASRLGLTEKSDRIITRMREHRNSRIKKFMSALDTNEQEQLLGLLEKAILQIDHVKK